MNETQTVSNRQIVKCPKCSKYNYPGLIRCKNCNSSLRPTFLGAVTLLGPIILTIGAIISLAQFANIPIVIFNFLFSLVGIVILISLRYGRYSAWIALQIVWVIPIPFLLILALTINPLLIFVAGGQAMVITPLWLYIRSKRVKAFCSVGRQFPDYLKDFSEKLKTDLGENLKSITIIGSSLTEDFKPGSSDINTVLVLGIQNLASLNTVATLAKPMRRKKISPPLLMTQSYIERSRDVFGVEFLDFQLAHKTVMGDDPFASLEFDKKDVRLQCERELKAMLIRLRQGYIAAAANKKLVRDILISTAKGMLPLLRAMLWLKDADRSARGEATFAKASEEFSIDTNPLRSAIKWRHEKIRLSETEMENAYESVYSAVEQLSEIVDKLKV